MQGLKKLNFKVTAVKRTVSTGQEGLLQVTDNVVRAFLCKRQAREKSTTKWDPSWATWFRVPCLLVWPRGGSSALSGNNPPPPFYCVSTLYTPCLLGWPRGGLSALSGNNPTPPFYCVNTLYAMFIGLATWWLVSIIRS